MLIFTKSKMRLSFLFLYFFSTARFFCSQRFTLAFLAFMGNLFVYTLRVNLSVAIMCMVRTDSYKPNTTHYLKNNATNESSCGNSDDQLLDVASNKVTERFEYFNLLKIEALVILELYYNVHFMSFSTCLPDFVIFSIIQH